MASILWMVLLLAVTASGFGLGYGLCRWALERLALRLATATRVSLGRLA